MGFWAAIWELLDDEALIVALRTLRAKEARACNQLSAESEDAILRVLMAGELPYALTLAMDDSLSLDQLIECCLQLRGPRHDAMKRMLLRERARVAGYVAGDAAIPTCMDDLLTLWEQSVCGDVRVYEDGLGRLRTEADHVPFSHGPRFFDEGVVPERLETLPVAFVAEETDRLISFKNDDAFPCELRAFVAHWLVFRVHPFVDGNGRIARMLAAGLLAKRYRPVTALSFISTILDRYEEVCEAEEHVGLDGRGLEQLVQRYVDCLSEAQMRVCATMQVL